MPLELWFDNFEQARNKLLSPGGAVKALQPETLRYSMVDYAEQVFKLYGEE